jgi:hypothetical protein
MIHRDPGRQIPAQAIAEESGDPCHHGGSHPDQVQGAFKRPGSDEGRHDQTILRGITDPDPLTSVVTLGQAFPLCIRGVAPLAHNKVPQLIELDVGDVDLAQQVRVDRFGFERCPPQPFDQGLFGNPKHKADRRELDSNQQQLQRHHDFFLRRPQVKEDRVTGLGERPSTVTAFENAPGAALCCVGRNRAEVSLVHALILVTHWIRTRFDSNLSLFFKSQVSYRMVFCRKHTVALALLFFKVLADEYLKTIRRI